MEGWLHALYWQLLSLMGKLERLLFSLETHELLQPTQTLDPERLAAAEQALGVLSGAVADLSGQLATLEAEMGEVQRLLAAQPAWPRFVLLGLALLCLGMLIALTISLVTGARDKKALARTLRELSQTSSTLLAQQTRLRKRFRKQTPEKRRGPEAHSPLQTAPQGASAESSVQPSEAAPQRREPPLSIAEQLAHKINGLIAKGKSSSWRRLILREDTAFADKLLPVEPGPMAAGAPVLQSFDDSQEKKFFGFQQGDVLYIYPNSSNLSDVFLRTGELFEGFDPSLGFASVLRPAQAQKAKEGWRLTAKGLLG